MPKWADLLVGVCLGLFVAGGAYLLYLGLRNVWWSWASLSWPAANGTVSESRTEQRTSRDSESGVRSSMHEARLAFTFSAHGRQYLTGRLYFGQAGGSSDSSEAELLRLRYPPGSPVRIHYNPADPSRAVVKPGFHADVLWLPGAGLVFALSGVMFLAIYFSGQFQLDGMAIGLTLFALIIGLAGASMLAVGGRNLWLGYSSRGWPAAAGEIVYAMGESSESVSTDDEGTRTHSTTYSTRIVYKYTAAGAVRYGNTVRFGQLSGSSQQWASEIARRYPRGRQSPVACRPGDEDTSVLEPGLSSDAWWIPGIGLVCLLFAAAVAIILVPAAGEDPSPPPGLFKSSMR
jgi:hypothetical protein